MSDEKKPETESESAELSEKDLEQVSGGAVDYFLNLNGIKGEATD